MLKNCLAIFFLFLTTSVLGQKVDSISGSECALVKAIIADAATGFKKLSGNFIDISGNDSTFKATIQYPAAISSVVRKKEGFVATLYNGMSYQYFDTVYVNVLNTLYDCLSPDEYEVLHIRESGNAQAKYYPDIEFHPREVPNQDTSHVHEASPKLVKPSKTSKPSQPVKPLPLPIVKRPVTIYIKANGSTAPGTYRIEVLIHPI